MATGYSAYHRLALVQTMVCPALLNVSLSRSSHASTHANNQSPPDLGAAIHSTKSGSFSTSSTFTSFAAQAAVAYRASTTTAQTHSLNIIFFFCIFCIF